MGLPVTVMTQIRALTVRQPWAEAIVDGHKPTENRSQGFPKTFRGILLIHAGKGWSVRGQRSPLIRNVYDVEHRVAPATFDAMARGAVIGLVYVPEIHPASGCCAPWGEETYAPSNPELRPPGRVTHLTLEHPVRLPRPIPATGRLGLWIPDYDLRLEVAHALAELVTWDRAGAETVAGRADVAQLYTLLVDDRWPNP